MSLKELADKSRWALPIALLALLFLALRLPALEADPPMKLPYGINTRELWAEGAAKAHEARNYALFGHFRTNPVDNYQFWRPQAPVWVYSLAATFKLLGVSIWSARLHSVVVALLGFVALLVYARTKLSQLALLALGVFLAASHFYIQYTRVGLVEPMVNLFAVTTLLCAYRALDDPSWLFYATVSFLLGVFSKMSGLVLLPVLGVSAFVSIRRAELDAKAALSTLAPSLILLASAAVYMTSGEYRQRAAWAVAHVGYAKEGQVTVDTDKLELLSVLERYFSVKRWIDRFFLLFPVAAVCSIPAIVHTVREFARSRRVGWDELNLLWLVSVHASLQLSPLTDIRFYLCLFPPVALLGARGLDLASTALARQRGAAAALACAAIGLCLFIELPRHAAWFQARTYGVREANRQVREHVGARADAVLVGLWAPWLTLETPYKFYIVRERFNVTKEALGQLGITHLVLAPGDRSGKFVQKSFPRPFREKRALTSFDVYTQHITLYELPETLGAPRAAANADAEQP